MLPRDKPPLTYAQLVANSIDPSIKEKDRKKNKPPPIHHPSSASTPVSSLSSTFSDVTTPAATQPSHPSSSKPKLSKDPPNHPFSLIAEADAQYRSFINNRDLFSPESQNARARVCKLYSQAFLTHPLIAHSKDLEVTIWKSTFYPIINEFRRLLKNAKTDSDRSSSHIESQFRTFVQEASGFYHNLIHTLHHLLKLPPTYLPSPPTSATASVESSPNDVQEKEAAYLVCFRSYIYLGDLARYRDQLSSSAATTDLTFALAKEYYQQALHLVPENGNPHNQLAIVATNFNDTLGAIYHYTRSILTSQPFSTSRENLSLLFHRYLPKQSPANITSAATATATPTAPATSSSFPPCFLSIFESLDFVELFPKLLALLYHDATTTSLTPSSLQDLLSSGLGGHWEALEKSISLMVEQEMARSLGSSKTHEKPDTPTAVDIPSSKESLTPTSEFYFLRIIACAIAIFYFSPPERHAFCFQLFFTLFKSYVSLAFPSFATPSSSSPHPLSSTTLALLPSIRTALDWCVHSECTEWLTPLLGEKHGSKRSAPSPLLAILHSLHPSLRQLQAFLERNAPVPSTSHSPASAMLPSSSATTSSSSTGSLLHSVPSQLASPPSSPVFSTSSNFSPSVATDSIHSCPLAEDLYLFGFSPCHAFHSTLFPFLNSSDLLQAGFRGMDAVHAYLQLESLSKALPSPGTDRLQRLAVSVAAFLDLLLPWFPEPVRPPLPHLAAATSQAAPLPNPPPALMHPVDFTPATSSDESSPPPSALRRPRPSLLESLNATSTILKFSKEHPAPPKPSYVQPPTKPPSFSAATSSRAPFAPLAPYSLFPHTHVAPSHSSVVVAPAHAVPPGLLAPSSVSPALGCMLPLAPNAPAAAGMVPPSASAAAAAGAAYMSRRKSAFPATSSATLYPPTASPRSARASFSCAPASSAAPPAFHASAPFDLSAHPASASPPPHQRRTPAAYMPWQSASISDFFQPHVQTAAAAPAVNANANAQAPGSTAPAPALAHPPGLRSSFGYPY